MNELPDQLRVVVDAVVRVWPDAAGHLSRAGHEIVAGLRCIADAIEQAAAAGSGEVIEPVPIRREESQ